MKRISRLWVWSAAALMLLQASSIALGALPVPKREVDTSLVKVRIEPAGSLLGWSIRQFDEQLIQQSYARKDEPLALQGGLFVGPVGKMSANAKLATTVTSNGAFLTWDPTGKWLPKGVQVERLYRFTDDSYVFEVDVALRNTTDKMVPLTSELGDTAFWLGPVLASEGYSTHEIVGLKPPASVETLKGTDAVQATAPGLKWIGTRENFYSAVLEEKKGRGNYLYALADFEEPKGTHRQGVILGFRYQYPELRARETAQLSFRLYLGPKLEQPLLTAGYPQMFNNWDGLTGGIGKLMFHMLHFFHRVTGSYGISILLLTLLVKLVLHPMNMKQLRSMQKLQALQPKMQDLKKRYPDSREFQTEVQKLYMEHDVNPLGGCLPILLQIPIFIALYSCLMGAIELKKVSFLWMPDLAKRDPIALLPMLFAGSIYLSSKMTANTQQVDKTQQSVMQIMPIMMLVLMVNVPSGVMIYLAGQSVLSIFENHWNQKQLKQEEAAAEAARGKRKKTRKGQEGA